MTRFPKKLQEKLALREVQNTLRHLPEANDLIDFSSNDYLGLSRNLEIFERASQILSVKNSKYNGATGSRLLSGNHPLYSELEEKLMEFHQSESALVFNSGYDANIGFFGAVPQRGDIVIYDELIHASIRDGIKMGNAKSYKFKHNDIADLKKRCEAEASIKSATEMYIVTESVFSMDGDSPDLKAFAEFCQKNGFHFIVDEAHAVGVFGKNGEGLIQELGLQDVVFARIVTFGKAMGCHGAAILGSTVLTQYLVNFARSLIYTTALSPHAVATIMASYEYLLTSENEGVAAKGKPLVDGLVKTIAAFNDELASEKLLPFFIQSTSAIHCCVISGNERVQAVATKMRKEGFDVKAIRSPTVPQGKERLRICLHSYNTASEIVKLLESLSICIKSP